MSLSKPLGYASLQAVLANMEPNLRITISQKLPSLKNAERAVTLKIERLEVGNHTIKVNDTCYSLSVTCLELGEYGFRIFRFRGRMYNVRNEIRSHYDYFPSIGVTPGDLVFRDRGVRPTDSLRFLLRRPMLTPYLMFSINNIHHSFLEYDTNFYLGMKYIAKKILGGRGVPPNVKYFSLIVRTPENILRLPKDLKVKAHNLKVQGSWNGIEIVRPVLSPESFPLEHVATDVVEERDHRFLNLARKVVILENPTGTNFHLPFRLAYINDRHGQDSTRFLTVVRSWRSQRRDIGTRFTFGLNPVFLDRTLSREFELLKQEPGAIVGEVPEIRSIDFPDCIILPIDDNSEINIYIVEMAQNLDASALRELVFLGANTQYNLEIKVERKGFAVAK